jgi:hypothetical protein
MAGTLALNVEILGEFKNLTKATKGAGDQLSKLNKTTSGISSGMIKALGAIGIGFSLAAVTQQFTNLTKAAIDDAKSQEILALAMINTGKATDFQVAQAEKLIGKMQITAAVADDELRPAFQKFFIATGDVTKSQKLLQIALDASAGTGKDLDSVSQAMSKSLAGSDVALVKLIPSIRGATDPMQVLEDTFKGAAEAAADTDPYQRISIIMGEIQEIIGTLLLPILESFADWFVQTYPKIQDFFSNVGDAINSPEVKEALENLNDSFGNLGDTLTELFAIPNQPDAKNFALFFEGIAKTIEFIVASVDFVLNLLKDLPYLRFVTQLVDSTTALLTALGMAQFNSQVPVNDGRSNQPRSSGPVINNNISVQTNATAQDIANAINKANKNSGTNLLIQ